MQYNRFLPLIVPLIAYGLSQIFYFRPNLIYVILVLQLLLFFFTARQFIIISYKTEKWWNLVILPFLFSTGLIVFSALIPNLLVVQILYLLNLVFLYFYFRTIYYYLIKTDSYNQYHLENLAAYGNFLTFYMIASSIYGLEAFLNLPVWVMVITLAITTMLIVHQVMWANLINPAAAIFYILIVAMIIVEVAWSISFLTLSYYVLGLLLAVCYYVTIGLVKAHLLDRLDRRSVQLYLSFGLLSIIIVLLTSRWI